MTVIKRYSNRRLYDTHHSRYVTLDEMALRIRDGEDFRVVDAEDNTDLTHLIHLQIMLHESLYVAEVLPVEFLRMVIRLRDHTLRALFVRYLRLMMESYSLAARQAEESLRMVQEQMGMTLGVVRGLFPFGGSTASRDHEPPKEEVSEDPPPRRRGRPKGS